MQTKPVHPLTPGQRITVQNQTLGGRPIVEGEATIVRHIQGDDIAHLYEVRFDDEPSETYERWHCV